MWLTSGAIRLTGMAWPGGPHLTAYRQQETTTPEPAVSNIPPERALSPQNTLHNDLLFQPLNC